MFSLGKGIAGLATGGQPRSNISQLLYPMSQPTATQQASQNYQDRYGTIWCI